MSASCRQELRNDCCTPAPESQIIVGQALTAESVPQPMEDIDNGLAMKQEELRDAREAALAARYSMQIQRAELSGIRQQAGTMEAIFMAKLDSFLRNLGLEFPVELKQGHDEVRASRESLGSVEATYTEAEENYNLLEWRFTQKESNFYMKARANSSSTNGVYEDQHLLQETEDATRFADGPDEPHDGQMPEGNSFIPIFDDYSPSPSASVASGGAITWKRRSLPLDTRSHVDDHGYERTSITFQQSPGPSVPQSSAATSYTEEDTVHAQQLSLETRKEIDNWILRTVQCSYRERKLLKDIFSCTEMPYEAWWRLAMHYWSLDHLQPIYREAILPPSSEKSSICTYSAVPIPVVDLPRSEAMRRQDFSTSGNMNAEAELQSETSHCLNNSAAEGQFIEIHDTVISTSEMSKPLMSATKLHSEHSNSGGSTVHSGGKPKVSAKSQETTDVMQMPAHSRCSTISPLPVLSVGEYQTSSSQQVSEIISDKPVQKMSEEASLQKQQNGSEPTLPIRSKSDPGNIDTVVEDQRQNGGLLNTTFPKRRRSPRSLSDNLDANEGKRFRCFFKGVLRG
ncbi:hypothetical protein BCR34DRAFT_596433 [Clohesyomyces aquaticus]|uniref:Uncharacterized protein n=1 Tax=Clohesyomyces aquaticus TaxID=1231657 RepID=A0A1Y2A6P0_9PLEO|nr:hypothetical protein BCR34DRAFT_596433 [Clohesyomyces aquaticus]